MAWELIPRGEWKSVASLEESQCAIAKDGTLTFRESLLKSVGIDQFAVLLADTATLRIGLRAPKEHELPRAVRVHVVRGAQKRDTGRRSLRGTRAFHAICLESAACAGRIELAIKERTLILNLAHIELGKGDAVE